MKRGRNVSPHSVEYMTEKGKFTGRMFFLYRELRI